MASLPEPVDGPTSNTSVDWRQRPGVSWSVHLLTGTGVLCGLFALLAVIDDSPRAALLWLLAAQVVDGIDGPIARACRVRDNLPNIDGYILDLVIDYVTCVLVPAVFLYKFNLLPYGLNGVGASLVLLSSLYCFSRHDLMTDDNWFNGFPAVWNLVVTVVFLLDVSPVVAAFVVFGLAVLTFTRVKFVHPMRVVELRPITIPITVGWIAAMLWLIVDYPHRNIGAAAVLMLGCAWFFVLTMRRTLLDRRDAELAARPATH